MHRTVLAVALLAGASLIAMTARAAVPDGGPGGACLEDADCAICGWVCSASRGNICIPAKEGDVGQCLGSRGCACPAQKCMAGTCSPAPDPQCWCNGDCPTGESCDQLLFTCHGPSAVYCGKSYDGYDYGPPTTTPACGCNGICAIGSDGGLACGAQGSFTPANCASDMDCGACYQGSHCLDGTCTAPGGAGWCTDSRDLAPLLPGRTSDAGPDAGTSTARSAGCGSGGSTSPMAAVLMGLLALHRVRRWRRS